MRIGGESPAYEMVPVSPASPDVEGREVRAVGRAGAFAQAMHGIGGVIDKGEALIASAAHGNLGGMDSAQLIALQAGIYRYSEAVDLVGKLVDRAATAVKTVVSPH